MITLLDFLTGWTLEAVFLWMLFSLFGVLPKTGAVLTAAAIGYVFIQ